jgi:hypothetical protein
MITNEEGLASFLERGCVTLDGSLTISSPTLENLGGLVPSTLRAIHEDLHVRDNAVLTNIEGLAGLERIQGSLTVEGNALLESLDGLENVSLLGTDPALNTLVLGGNAALTSVEALGAATNGTLIANVGLVITSNATLTSLRGINARPDRDRRALRARGVG